MTPFEAALNRDIDFDVSASIASCTDEGRQSHPYITDNGFYFRALREKINSYLLLKDDSIISFLCGSIVAHGFGEEPVWPMLIGPPSSAKTELLEGLAGIPAIFRLSDLTPNTFLSGAKKKGDNDEEKDLSLLHRINGRIMLMKDFTTVLCMNRDKRAAILSQLREIYDGSFSKAYGTGAYRDWHGRVGFVGAVTPAIDKHRSVMSSMGERFTFYRVQNPDRRGGAEKALDNVMGGRNKNGMMRKEIKAAFAQWHSTVPRVALSDITVENDTRELLLALSDLATKVRTDVDRTPDGQRIVSVPEAEGPQRMIKQLYLLGAGVAVTHGHRCVGKDEAAVLRKVAKDAMPWPRLAAITLLAGMPNLSATTREMSGWLSLPFSSTKMVLEDLTALGLVTQRLSDPVTASAVPASAGEEATLDGSAATESTASGGCRPFGSEKNAKSTGPRPYLWTVTEATAKLVETCGIKL